MSGRQAPRFPPLRRQEAGCTPDSFTDPHSSKIDAVQPVIEKLMSRTGTVNLLRTFSGNTTDACIAAIPNLSDSSDTRQDSGESSPGFRGSTWSL